VTETYRRAVFVGPREVRLDELPIPEPGPRQALVKVRACAICTWEQRLFSGEEPLYPLAGGHEVSGELVKLGSQVYTDARIGDRVVAAPLARCGYCESCRRGLDSICDNARSSFRASDVAGPAGLAEYILLDDYQLYKASNTVSFEELCLTEPLGCVIRSMRKAQVERADSVVVIGAGIMGLLHLILCKRMGARVIVSELDPARAALARTMGADEVIDPAKESLIERVKALTAGRGADVIFCAVSVAAAVEQAVEAVAKGGRVMVYASIYPRAARIVLDPNLFHSKEITLTGTVSQSKEDVLQSVRLISGGMVDVKPLISLAYPFSRLQEALQASLRRDIFRVLVTM
jgi:2-desacetyl-2-hydroxyethyl bacteriochlorophyllide A dehydrogenase